MKRPNPSTRGRDLSTTLGLIAAHPAPYTITITFHRQLSSEESPPPSSSNFTTSGLVVTPVHGSLQRARERGSPTCPCSTPLRLDPQASGFARWRFAPAPAPSTRTHATHSCMALTHPHANHLPCGPVVDPLPGAKNSQLLSTSVGTPTGPRGCEPNDERAADGFSEFEGKWSLMSSPHMLFHTSPRVSGARSGLDTGNSSSWIGGTSCSTSICTPADPDGCELDDGRAANDSGPEGKWPSTRSRHLFHPSLGHSSYSSLRLGGARSGLGTCDGPLGTDGSGRSTSIDPSTSSDGGELDGECAADNSSELSGEWLSMRLRHILFQSSPRLGGARSGLDTGNSS
jgi:hypothetical protein